MNHILAIILGQIAKLFSVTEPVLAATLENEFPQEAPFIALADGVYQVYQKNPSELDGLVIPMSIDGVKYNNTITKA